MRDLIDMRVPGLGLAPARHLSVVNEAERLAYFGDRFDRTTTDACVDDRGTHSGTRRATPATRAAAVTSAR